MPNIRVRNSTGIDLEVVRVFVPAGQREAIDMGRLDDRAVGEYRNVPIAYRFIEVEVSGMAGRFTLQPYDYVGERPLPEGLYTYNLGIARGQLTLDLEEDSSAD